MYPAKRLEPTSVYILDLGDKLFGCIGSLCETHVVQGALAYIQNIKAARGGTPVVETLNHVGKGDNGVRTIKKIKDRARS